jgi:hypothetical protein
MTPLVDTHRKRCQVQNAARHRQATPSMRIAYISVLCDQVLTNGCQLQNDAHWQALPKLTDRSRIGCQNCMHYIFKRNVVLSFLILSEYASNSTTLGSSNVFIFTMDCRLQVDDDDDEVDRNIRVLTTSDSMSLDFIDGNFNDDGTEQDTPELLRAALITRCGSAYHLKC